MMKIRRGGFTLSEGVLLVAVLGLLVALALPMLGAAKSRMRGLSSQQKLMLMGQGGMMYAQDNADRLFSYSWRAGETYTLPDGRTRTHLDDFEATGFQNTEILMRHTGRISGIHKIQILGARLPHRRFAHLVLLDYLGQPIDTDAYIDPSDGKQLTWTSRPLEFGPGSGVPYADGIPDGHDADGNWQLTPVRQRWAFASSYQVVPVAWQQNWPGPRYIPVETTPHLFMGTQAGVDLSTGRRITEVLHTGNKVWVHEEFDRDRTRHLWFGYDDARTDKLMFDGSVNNYASGDAAPSVVPERGFFHWMSPYVPLDRFPIPLGGLGDQTPVSQRFRWTFSGLSGVDYGPFSFD